MLKAMIPTWIGLMFCGFVSCASADSPPISSSVFVIKGDSVYDGKTDLTWARCSVGQQWKEGSGCTGQVKTFTFDEAQLQGTGGWRVPTKGELGTLVDKARVVSKQKPTIDEAAFPNMDAANLGYWTSTPAGTTGGWDVYFYDGSVTGYYGYKSNSLAVRLVRNGQ
jgi:hypothetical protein